MHRLVSLLGLSACLRMDPAPAMEHTSVALQEPVEIVLRARSDDGSVEPMRAYLRELVKGSAGNIVVDFQDPYTPWRSTEPVPFVDSVVVRQGNRREVIRLHTQPVRNLFDRTDFCDRFDKVEAELLRAIEDVDAPPCDVFTIGDLDAAALRPELRAVGAIGPANAVELERVCAVVARGALSPDAARQLLELRSRGAGVVWMVDPDSPQEEVLASLGVQVQARDLHYQSPGGGLPGAPLFSKIPGDLQHLDSMVLPRAVALTGSVGKSRVGSIPATWSDSNGNGEQDEDWLPHASLVWTAGQLQVVGGDLLEAGPAPWPLLGELTEDALGPRTVDFPPKPNLRDFACRMELGSPPGDSILPKPWVGLDTPLPLAVQLDLQGQQIRVERAGPTRLLVGGVERPTIPTIDRVLRRHQVNRTVKLTVEDRNQLQAHPSGVFRIEAEDGSSQQFQVYFDLSPSLVLLVEEDVGHWVGGGVLRMLAHPDHQLAPDRVQPYTRPEVAQIEVRHRSAYTALPRTLWPEWLFDLRTGPLTLPPPTACVKQGELRVDRQGSRTVSVNAFRCSEGWFTDSTAAGGRVPILGEVQIPSLDP